MGPVEPPQRKGQYNRGKLVELQETFDQLEDLGVFQRPEEAGVTVEYLNPSFLVKKPNGGHRLVTALLAATVSHNPPYSQMLTRPYATSLNGDTS